MIEGFESGLRGQAAGATVTLAVEFPADYRNDALAGKAASFEVTIKRVAEPLLPAVDDAFFARFGVTQGGLPAFRAEVRANMEKERDRALRQRFSAEVMERVSAANDFELPASLIENEAQRLRQQVARDLIMRGVNPNQAGEQLERTVRERARQRVKLGLVMAEIVKTAQLRADPSKVRQRIEALASSYEDAPAVVKWYYENPEQLQQVEAMCLEDEAVDWIASRAHVKTALVSFDALLNPVQTGAQPEAST
jgi:trigger factor